MFEIRCIQCGKKASSLLERLFRPIYTTLECPFCHWRLELINAGICHFISGIIFAVLLVLLFIIEPPFLWIWIILLGFVCWFLNICVVCLLGRWGIWSYKLAQSSRLELLSSINAVSTIIAAVWVFFMAKTLLMPYFDLFTNFDLADDRIAEAIEHYKRVFSVKGVIGIIIGFVSIATSGTTGFIKGRMRRQAVEKSLSQITAED